MTESVSKGQKTRERILELAEKAVLQKGFAGTSIDELTAAAEITKSGFLYHFKDKSDLAKHMLLRFLKQDDEIFDGLFERADELSDDPLHSFLVFLKLLAEMLDEMETTHPGCLTAAYSYQDRLFNDEVKTLNKQGVLAWRDRFQTRLEAIAKEYPPKEDVDLVALADYISTVIEGGIVLSRAIGDNKILGKQILLGRDHIKRIFTN